LERVAVPEAKRLRFPLQFAEADGVLKKFVKQLEKNPEDRALFADKHERPEDWDCTVHGAVYWADDLEQERFVREKDKQAMVRVWMSGADRLGVIALLINDDPKLAAFVPSAGTRVCVSVFDVFVCVSRRTQVTYLGV
jgi:hypothetical protein